MPSSSNVDAWLVLMIRLRNSTFLIRSGCSSGSLLRAAVSLCAGAATFMTDPSFGALVKWRFCSRIVDSLCHQQIGLCAMAADRGALRQVAHRGKLRVAHTIEAHGAAADERAR